METKKGVVLTECFWELRLAWLNGQYKTKEQKDELIAKLLDLLREALQG